MRTSRRFSWASRHTQGGHRRPGLLEKCFRLGNFRSSASHPAHFDQLQKMCIGIDDCCATAAVPETPSPEGRHPRLGSDVIRVPTDRLAQPGVQQQPRLCRGAALRKDRFPSSLRPPTVYSADLGCSRELFATEPSGLATLWCKAVPVASKSAVGRSCAPAAAAAARAWRTRAKAAARSDFGQGAVRQSEHRIVEARPPTVGGGAEIPASRTGPARL